MEAVNEGRISDSPYIEAIWQGHAGDDYKAVCPADERWNMLFMKQCGQVKVTVEGPLTQALFKKRNESSEWLVIKFKLGTFIPYVTPISDLLDRDATLPEAASHSFWLNGAVWQFPTFDNVETFVSRLVRNDILLADPIVNAVLQNRPQDISSRTVRRRFLRATGLTHKTIQQIERARYAMTLLQQGISILDVVYEAGYADQPHMTRSLKHFIGQTPAQIVREASGDSAYSFDDSPLMANGELA